MAKYYDDKTIDKIIYDYIWNNYLYDLQGTDIAWDFENRSPNYYAGKLFEPKVLKDIALHIALDYAHKDKVNHGNIDSDDDAVEIIHSFLEDSKNDKNSEFYKLVLKPLYLAGLKEKINKENTMKKINESYNIKSLAKEMEKITLKIYKNYEDNPEWKVKKVSGGLEIDIEPTTHDGVEIDYDELQEFVDTVIETTGFGGYQNGYGGWKLSSNYKSDDDGLDYGNLSSKHHY